MNEAKKIGMLVFDWAGTTVDYGSSAPAEVFRRVFTAEGIHLTREEINKPMGLEKKAHIRALLGCESGSSQWKTLHGADWTGEDVERLYQAFEAELFQVVAEYSAPIAGVVETVEQLRGQGLKIGSTTGYNSHMMEQVIPKARQLGYEPDCVVTPDVTGYGRPTPFMLFECMRRLQVYPPETVIKVGDTIADILEGKNAGAWSVGILTGSNLLGLTEEEYQAVDPETLRQKKCLAADRYRESGADLVIDSITDLPLAVEEINRRLAKKEAEQ
ncbi:MAG TPA: phosphonoacetaldehyde hydrolase [Candidatus Enterocloster excrementigallinarum]|uniref:Phosphonoacetaldehyde hydrolase n=1 Tax=Candidatus Enterocloster excrementigallinarum TaxID=2838558 RepID=A0A9D2TFS4_9FIRM|nr:phosphonoacetaldehyde hydrolase [Candidatus Enterocloster excrementigallinarum]